MDDFDELADAFLKRKMDEDKERGINSKIRFDESRALGFLGKVKIKYGKGISERCRM